MTNEEIYLYKKAQNGGKSDPKNTTEFMSVSKSIDDSPQVTITVTKITE